MPRSFSVDLEDIQPSQLYVSSKKLSEVAGWFRPQDESFDYDPLPVIYLNDDLILTDGHTRALHAHTQGVEKIEVKWETDDLSWEMYEECITWCEQEGVTKISDLEDRVLPHDEFEVKWIERCRRRRRELGVKS